MHPEAGSGLTCFIDEDNEEAFSSIHQHSVVLSIVIKKVIVPEKYIKQVPINISRISFVL